MYFSDGGHETKQFGLIAHGLILNLSVLPDRCIFEAKTLTVLFLFLDICLLFSFFLDDTIRTIWLFGWQPRNLILYGVQKNSKLFMIC